MKSLSYLVAALVPAVLLPARAAFATAFSRPVPNAQTETAEGWFLVASLCLILALVAVQWLVARR